MKHAKYLELGPIQKGLPLIPIREHVAKINSELTDRELMNKTLPPMNGSAFIDPEGFSEMIARRLVFSGWHTEDIIREVERREAEAK